jgi:hypothetical protein
MIKTVKECFKEIGVSNFFAGFLKYGNRYEAAIVNRIRGKNKNTINCAILFMKKTVKYLNEYRD